ncbi:MAG: protein kinase [Polyangiaceae bacterium]|nr:protein kinase [Polyangiaceae bacterium]
MRERPGTIVAGKYRLEKPLARGGVGTVWVAHHLELGNSVAVKFLDPRVASSPQVRSRFEREARAAAHMRSPHIVQVFDYGITGDTPYLVMELLHGETLHSRLRRVKRMGFGDVYRLLVQLGKGLRRAHEAGFVHRDLKPANIYLAHGDDEEDLVKILDFGIAKETNAEVGESTKTGELLGSPHYMSPEQVRGQREVDARSDLWAVGVIIFKMLSGELPFPGEVLTAVITQIVVDPLPSLRSLVPDAPPAVDGFFAKAFSRDREQRFQNIRELVAAFGEIAAFAEHVPSAAHLAGGGASGARTPMPSGIDGLMPTMTPTGTPLPSSFPGSASGSYPGASLSGALAPPGVPQFSMADSAVYTPVPAPSSGSLTPAPIANSGAPPSGPVSNAGAWAGAGGAPAAHAPKASGARMPKWVFGAVVLVLLVGIGAFAAIKFTGDPKVADAGEPPRAALSVDPSKVVPPRAAAPGETAGTPTVSAPEIAPTEAPTAAPAPSASASQAATAKPRSTNPTSRGGSAKKPVDTID